MCVQQIHKLSHQAASCLSHADHDCMQHIAVLCRFNTVSCMPGSAKTCRMVNAQSHANKISPSNAARASCQYLCAFTALPLTITDVVETKEYQVDSQFECSNVHKEHSYHNVICHCHFCIGNLCNSNEQHPKMR